MTKYIVPLTFHDIRGFQYFVEQNHTMVPSFKTSSSLRSVHTLYKLAEILSNMFVYITNFFLCLALNQQ